MQKDRDHIYTSALAPLVKEYLDSQKKGHRPASLEAWARALANLQTFLSAQGRQRLQDITSTDLEAWRVDLGQQGFAPASLEIYGRTARQFFQWLENNQRLFLNPASGFVVPRPERTRLPVLNVDQIEKLLAQPDAVTPCGVRDRALLEVAYATGLLAHELQGLRCQDINGSVHVRKGRNLPLTVRASEWLQRYQDEARLKLLALKSPTPALWLNYQGGPLRAGAMQQIFRRHSMAAGLGAILPYAMRRACAVHRWQKGADPVELQLLLGHASQRILAQYMRLTITELVKGKETHEKQVA